MIGITGSTGILGGIFVELLKKKEIEWTIFDGDVCDFEQMHAWISREKIDYLIHFAAKVPVSFVNNHPIDALTVNALGTFNILKSITLSSKNTWFFYASTSHVYASKNSRLLETDVLGPQSTYGKTKLIGEEYVRYFMDHGGVKACIGRIFSFFDEKQDEAFLYPAIMNRLQHHDISQPFVLTNGYDVRDILPAKEVVQLIDGIREKGYEGVVNIGSGVGTRIVDFVQDLADTNKVNVVVDQQREPISLVADITKLEKILHG